MKYSVFLMVGILTCMVRPLWAQDREDPPIEIFSGGKHYDSLEGYRNKGKEEPDKTGVENSGMDFSEARQMFDEAVRSSANPMDLKFDPTKMKTVYITPQGSDKADSPSEPKEAVKDPLAQSFTRLNELDANAPIKEVVSQFALSPTAGREKKVISAKDLEQVLRDSFGESNQPLLLMSDDNKLRIMTLDPQDPEAVKKLKQRTEDAAR